MFWEGRSGWSGFVGKLWAVKEFGTHRIKILRGRSCQGKRMISLAGHNGLGSHGDISIHTINNRSRQLQTTWKRESLLHQANEFHLARRLHIHIRPMNLTRLGNSQISRMEGLLSSFCRVEDCRVSDTVGDLNCEHFVWRFNTSESNSVMKFL